MDRPASLSRRGRACALALSLLVAACGGGADPPAPSSAAGQAPPALPAAGEIAPDAPRALPVAGEIAFDANVNGMWSRVHDWPMIPVHAALLPDGRVFSYGTDANGRQTGLFHYDFWEGTGAPDAGHQTIGNTSGTDLFCSAQLMLQTGDIWIAGGDVWDGTKAINEGNNNSNVVSAASGAIARGPDMHLPRWYASAITLPGGDIYVQGGAGGEAHPEVRQQDGSFRLLSGADTSWLNIWYPRNWVAPNGRIFGYEVHGIMYWIDPEGGGVLERAGRFGPEYRGNDATAAMFRPGRILQFGGRSNGAIVIDINAGSGEAVVTPTQSLSSQRRYVSSTILPDGKVLATGGSALANRLDGVNNRAETWDPATGQWTLGAEGALPRLYHSNALLLPDASVMVMGGGAYGPVSNLNVELYYPPYLFGADGQLAPRPAITDAPTTIELAQSFGVIVSGPAPARVTLIKTGSVTHNWNSEQRFRDLTWSVAASDASGTRLRVQAPARAGDAPPGYYHLFVLDAAGVPSVSSILRIGVQPAPPFGRPVLAAPGDQAGASGAPVSLQLSAGRADGQPLAPLRYAAAGLPAGLALDGATGSITGAPDAPGTYHVVLSADDGTLHDDANLVWTVSGPPQATITRLPAPAPAQAGSTITWTAAASGSNVRYRWNFGDGTPETAESPSPSATHSYSRAGTFPVTLTVIDDGGVPQRRSFLQAVHLPPTGEAPSASSNLLLEQSAGTERLWVVNQDQDTVSAFDAARRAKLGEVAVGKAPRAIARARDGLVWVSNRDSASISVIDPESLQVVQAIPLARGSMPFGIAMSPREPIAYVALEGSGELLSFDTEGFSQLGRARIGQHARHVSVAADGQSIYVSRFITPPLAGESGAAIEVVAGSGGEVLVVDGATMSTRHTIALAESDLTDAPTQGRGVPNYLGAVALSPDGTQAYVPGKQDNVRRGGLRDGLPLDFQNTVRAISSRIDLVAGEEDLDARIDHDDSSVASAALFDPLGVYLFVALETSREVAVIDVHDGFQLLRVAAGRAPQGLALSSAGRALYVNNFMDRTVGVYDLEPLLGRGRSELPLAATLQPVAHERLAADVLLGKQLFYDAHDPRLARDKYMSCASCHNDGGHDGRVWDMTSLGEGLRNTIGLRGRGAVARALHWSHNFDEVQDFETQIRALAGGSGLIGDAELALGTRALPLGDPKAGLSGELDALAAYLQSLSEADASPDRAPDGALSAGAEAGRAVFDGNACASCHASGALPADIGTIKTASGQRLGAALDSINVPPLAGAWASAPYLHDGSAATLADAVRAHRGLQIPDAQLPALSAYLRELEGGDHEKREHTRRLPKVPVAR